MFLFLKKFVLSVHIVILGLVTASLLVSYAFMNVYTEDVPAFLYTNPLLLLATLAYIFLLFALGPVLEKVRTRHLFLGFAIVYSILALHLIFNTNDHLKIDSASVYYFAHQMEAGNYADLLTPGGYLHRYPHQLGMALLNRFYFLIHPNPRTGYVFNLLFALGANGLQSLIVQQLFHKKVLTNYTIVLGFLFLPHFYFILFLYGSLPGLFLSSLAIYCMVLYHQKGNWLFLLPMSISMSLAVIIRNNYAIVALALIAISILLALQKKETFFKRGLAALVVVLSLFVGQFGLNAYVTAQTGQSIPEGIPKIAYVVMGLQEFVGRPTRAGWFNFYTFNLWEGTKYDSETSRKQAKVDLEKQVTEFIKNPMYAGDFFYRKVRNTWTEPLFSAVVSGTYEATKPEEKTIWARIARGEKEYIYYHNLAYVSLVSIYVFGLVGAVFLFRQSESLSRMLLFYSPVVFLGGFFFHLVWESRSQYSHYYAYILIPLAAYGLSQLSQRLNWKWIPGRRKDV